MRPRSHPALGAAATLLTPSASSGLRISGTSFALPRGAARSTNLELKPRFLQIYGGKASLRIPAACNKYKTWTNTYGTQVSGTFQSNAPNISRPPFLPQPRILPRMHQVKLMRPAPAQRPRNTLRVLTMQLRLRESLRLRACALPSPFSPRAMA